MNEIDQWYIALDKADKAGNAQDAREIAQIIRELESQKSDSPSIAKIGGGLAAEIAIAEGAKVAGAAGGTFVAGPVGSGVGYIVGAISGGITGSIAAQKIEGREDISYGRVVADTLLNLLPFGVGKTKQTLKAAKAAEATLPRLLETGKAVGKYVGKRGATGAAIGTAAMSIEKGIDEERWLTPEELVTVAGTSAALNIGLGFAGEAFARSYKKFAGKSFKVLDKAYEDGDVDAMAVVEGLMGEAPIGRFKRNAKAIWGKAFPETMLPKQITELAYDQIAKTKAATDLAVTVNRQLQKIGKGATQKEIESAGDYLFNRSNVLPKIALPYKESFDVARSKLLDGQKSFLELYKNGYLDLHPAVAAKIEKSVSTGDYKTREYKFFEELDFKPSAEAENKLRKAMIKQGAEEAEANDLIQSLYDKRTRVMDGLNFVSSNKRIFKKRDDLIPELREFLGEYKDVGQQVFGTLNRVGRAAAQEEGNKAIVDNLVKYGIAKVRYKGDDVMMEGMRPLMIGKRQMRMGAGDVYVDQITQDALSDLMDRRVLEGFSSYVEKYLGRAFATTRGLSKLANVPLNWASIVTQPAGNFTLAAMQGMNPFFGMKRGFAIGLTELFPSMLKNGKVSLKYYNRLKELDLVDVGAHISDIRASFQAGFGKKITRKIGDKIGKFYNIFDNAQRIAIFENWKGLLQKMLPVDELKKLTDSQIEEIAASMTNSTYMNYGRINKNLRGLSKYGILNEYAAFNLELVRTTFNQGKLIRNLHNGNFAKALEAQYGVKANQTFLKKEAIKRAAALSGVIAAGTAGFNIWNRTNGISAESEKATRESVAAPWEEEQALLIDIEGDKITLANASYQLPLAEMTSVAEAATRGDSFPDAASKAIKSLYGKFGGDLPIALNRAVSAWHERDITKGGERITQEQGFRKLLDQVMFYGEMFVPGTYRDIKNAKTRSISQNLLRWTVGYRARTTTFEKAIGYKLRDIRDSINGIRSKHTNNTFNSENLDRDYIAENETYKRNMEVLIKHVNNYRLIGSQNPETGLTDEKIGKMLTDNGLSKSVAAQALSGVIQDMPIAAKVSGAKPEKMRRYVQIGSKLSEPMLRKMLEQEFAAGKINRQDAMLIIGQIKLQAAQQQ